VKRLRNPGGRAAKSGLKWGIIGFGEIADRRFVPAIRRSKNSELVAVMARRQDKAEALSEKHGAKRFYTDAAELCNDPEINCVYVASPPFLHCEHTLVSAMAGKHVLCEKPMAVTVRECETMINRCRRQGVTLMIGHMMRFHDSHRVVRDMLKQGAVGRVTLVEANFRVSIPQIQEQQFDPRQFRLSKSEGGGGAIMDLGLHCIDTLRYVLDREVTEVFSFHDTLTLKTEVEDAAVIVLRFDNGLLGSVTVSFDVPYVQNNLAVHGERGAIVAIDSIAQVPGTRLELHLDGCCREERVPPTDSYLAEIEHFHRCILEGKAPLVSGEEGMANVKVAVACYESMKQAKAVAVE